MTQTNKPELTPLQRAFLALEETRARLARAEGALREPIAIIGLGCRVPGADDPAAFWNLLRDGVDAVTAPPAARFGLAAGDPLLRNAGYLRSIDGFEPEFFGISKREADGMDPQQRLLLEVSWEALEHAGQAPDRLERTATGVYVGICGTDYNSLQLTAGDAQLVNPHYASGIAHSVASGRISYVLGLQGPSLSIDTACSSSLVAVHVACQALRAGDCRMALAGGVNVMLSTEPFAAFAESRMLAPDGRCKTFDAAADGFARGEGCGIVVLKRLADAQADGDTIHAVIRGSAVNQDGPSSGLTAPNGPAQEAVIREALRHAGLRPRDIGYVEAHGTGTQLGDPLEVQALGEVFGPDRDRAQPLLLGAVKTNVGHLEAAAGVTGLIKIVLALQHEAVPAHLHFREPSPHIDWAHLPLRVPTALVPWEPIAGRRIGGVSSFGFSGTNAHVIVEQAPAPASPAAERSARRPAELFTLSARTPTALAGVAERVARSLERRSDGDLPDLCFTAGAGRAHLAERATLAVRGVDELRSALLALARGDESAVVRRGRVGRRDPPRIAFLFTGQGAQYAGMACSLYEHAPAFRSALDRCAAILDRHLPRPLLEVLRDQDAAARPLDQTLYTQPALFAVEYSLAELLRSWGIEPAIVLGHSVGEYVAACVAGMLPLEQALELIAARGRLMQSLPPGGGMTAIYAEPEEVAAAIGQRAATVAIAAINAPGQTVVSGDVAALREIAAQFAGRGVRVQPLAVSHAFHSPLVEPILDAFERLAGRVEFAAPQLRLISNRTGRVAAAGEMTNAAYWRGHLREAVLFRDSLATLAALKPDLCIELGPHPALLGFAKMSFGDGGPALVPTLRRERDDWTQLLETLSALHLGDAAIRWREVFAGQQPRIVSLPTYPFERERCWFSVRHRKAVPARPGGPPLLGDRLRSAGAERIHEFAVAADSPAFVAQHRVQGLILMPATGLLESLHRAARGFFARGAACIEQVTLQEALVIDDDAGHARTVQVVATPQQDGSVALKICSIAADAGADAGWTQHAHASAVPAASAVAAPAPTLADARRRCASEVDRALLYDRLASHGLDFGPAFHSVSRIWRGADCAVGEVDLAAELEAEAGSYAIHPVLLDGCVQLIAAAVGESDALYLPFSVGRYIVHRNPGAACWGFATLAAGASDATRQADITVFDTDGAPVAQLLDVRLKRVASDALGRLGRRWLDDASYEMTWLEAPAAPAATAATMPLDALSARALAALDGLRERAGLDRYDEFLPRLDRLCLDLTLRAMSMLGWQPEVGECTTAAALATRLGVAAQHGRLFGRLLEILSEDGLLVAARDGWRVERLLASVMPGDDATTLAAAYPAATAELEMTARAGAQFAAALRGECDPLQLLFPAGSIETAEKLYRDTPPAQVFNGLMAQIAAALAMQREAGRPLRILEIGAGTGGTTSHVLPLLPAQGVEYTFTDVGALFVARARERFAACPFMRFATLDLEQSPQTQGFRVADYDLVLASNVIHATRDLRTTLASVLQLMAPGATLAMLEVTAPQRWFDLTVGLTEGWWCFQDTDLRPAYATLSAQRWMQLLSAVGFEDAVAVPGDARRSATLDLNTMLLARKPAGAALATRNCWVVFADEAPVGHDLAARLRARGDRCIVVRPGTACVIDGDAATVDPAQPGHHRQLVAQVAGASGGVHCFVHAWQTGHAHTADELPDAFAAAALSRATSVMHLAQALVAHGLQARLWLLTRGAQQVAAGDTTIDAAQATVHGLARALSIEHPELRCTCIDLDPAGPDGECESLLDELAAPATETHVALRTGRRHVARLVRARGTSAGASDAGASDAGARAGWRLAPAQAGSLDRLERVPMARRAPGAGEVEIEIHATGLNFKDVLNVLGMYPGDPGPLGGECAGVVVAVGEGVADLRAGDDVMALGGGCFASHVTTRAAFVRRRAPGQSAAEGASIPIAFLTAAFCLQHLAGLQPGERVLIHAAAGGVGMAAVRLALDAGAEVFAAAGAPWKRELLRSMGVQHVFDSRSTDFARQVLDATGGAGVDVALNSLSGPQIEASFRALASGGRFVEIGKRDIKSQQWVDALGRNLKYSVVDWGQTAASDPALIGRMFAALAQRLESGALAPLPRHEFGATQAERAFRFMAQARHAGKIVVSLRDASAGAVQSNGTYLVTGGLSGLGPVVARWLAARGAGRVVLVSRRGVTADAEPLLREIGATATQVVAEALDVSDAAAVAALLRRLRSDGPPLRGIVHSAGVLADAALVQQDAARYARVFAPKVQGTALLETLTRSDPLDWTVYFSSIAAVLGSAGQGNHSAANAFLDALARDARLRGQAVSSINWGPWTEVGAAVDRGVAGRVGSQGIGAISPAQGLQALEHVLATRAAQFVLLPVDWPRFREQLPGQQLPPLLSSLAADGSAARATPQAAARGIDLKQQLADAPAARRRPLLAAFLRERALKVLGLDAARPIDPRTPLGDLGLDSLLAVELRNAIGSAVGRTLPATLLFDHPTLEALTDHLLGEICGRDESAAPAVTAPAAPQPGLVDSIEDLSDEEVERQLAERARRKH